MSRYVIAGADAEKNFVKMLNSHKSSDLWKKIITYDTTNLFAVRVITKKFSKINEEKISCKSDVFIAKGKIDYEILEKKDFFLDEEDMEKFNLIPEKGTGISIKKPDATTRTWAKIGIKGIGKIFSHVELGAGVSLYRQKGVNHNSVEHSLEQNGLIVTKWCGGWKPFEKFFSGVEEIEILKDCTIRSSRRCEIAKKIVKIADKQIKKQIDDNKEIQQKIFWGKGVFEEPFCASWVYENGIIQATKDYFPNYIITTGNSRTKNFNIAIKGGLISFNTSRAMFSTTGTETLFPICL